MSGIQGKKRENNFEEQKLYIGLAEVRVITINPDRETYKELLGIELQEDSKATEYLGESKDGNATCRIDVWVENVKTGKKNKITYFLENKVKENKTEENDGKVKKYQYINSAGSCTWAEDTDGLKDWFTKREYRTAFVGEEELYIFLRSWLSGLDYRDSETQILLDWKKLIKGNVKDITEQIGGEYIANFVALFEVKSVEKEGETKNYQSIYNKAFLPVYALKNFRAVNYDGDEALNKIKAKETKELKPHERFVLSVKGEYGSKNSFILKDVIEFNPDEYLVATNDTISSEDADY